MLIAAPVLIEMPQVLERFDIDKASAQIIGTAFLAMGVAELLFAILVLRPREDR